ncbi:effector-associated domain 2-containing protein [Streptomyces sp.]|uniref:VMAP-C domain-containing protein n=1 Tax=Streptomyces sp. TaxID=1931 RepID=UPI002D621ED7|nr:hypothetical protein [Streptomyces sp.]HZF92316.1 hypothetical protein [Streptomyces sp.]
MTTGAGFGTAGEPDEAARARGLELLLQLTDAFCELGCMADPQERTQFALVLGEHLNRPVDIRGVKLREDVVTLVRTALSVAHGERVLVTVVRIFEGAVAADELDRLIQPVAPPAPPLSGGPLSGHDEATARALLAQAQGEVPASRLRDDLVEELNGLPLPVGLTPGQLFAHVVEWNVQLDELPPAVLLVDRAARLASGHRDALAAWVDGWAQRAGLTEAVRRRRTGREAVTGDPDIPRCLIIAVEPTRDSSGQIVVRTWLNTVAGHWDPQPGEPCVTTLEGLAPAVERALQQGVRLWAAQGDPGPGGREQPPPYIEFVLPYDLLNHDVAGLAVRSGDGRPLPLGLRYGVHLRSLERMRTPDVLVRHQWRERWRALRQHGVTVHGWSEPDAHRFDAWYMSLAGEARHTAVVLDAPADDHAREALKAAIAEGIGLAVWDRRGVFVEERREVVTAVFASVPTPAQIPMAIHRLRQKAELHSQPHLLGKHIAFFWDDPTRPVDIHDIHPKTDHDDLAG